jgi:hypothetical protein
MPSKFAFSPEPRGRGIAWRGIVSGIAGATLFFELGAIAATALWILATITATSVVGGVV